MMYDLVPISDVAPAKQSNRKANPGEMVWNITLDQIDSNSGFNGEKQFIDFSSAPQSSNLVDENNVLYSKLRPYLNKVIIPDEIGIATTELVPLYPDKTKLFNKYLLYYLRSDSFVKWVSEKVSGAKMPRVVMKEFWGHKIPLPPLETQKRIVSLLDQAQELIDKRKEQIALMDQLIQSLFYDMFGDPVTNPKGWEIGCIGDLAVKTQYGTSKKAHETDGVYPILRMNNITYQGNWDLRDIKYIDLDEKELQKYLVYKDELLFNRTNSKELVGKTAVYNKDAPMAFAGYLIKLIPNDRATAQYISAYLNSKHGKAKLLSMAKNIVGMANINAEELKKIPINVPPIDLQRRFTNQLRSIEIEKVKMSNALKILVDNFNALMQRAFKGEL